jgi:hypothetical protein
VVAQGQGDPDQDGEDEADRDREGALTMPVITIAAQLIPAFFDAPDSRSAFLLEHCDQIGDNLE